MIGRRPAPGDRGAAVLALVLAAGVGAGGLVAGQQIATQLVVPAQVHLPLPTGVLSPYGLTVRSGEWLQRNSRTTISISKRHVPESPRVHLRQYGPAPAVGLDERLQRNRGAGDGAWFERACEPEHPTGTGRPGDDADGGQAEPAPAPQLDYGAVEQTDLGFEVDYHKTCPGQPQLDRHGRLLMMAVPGSDDGAAVMLDADLTGAGEPGPSPESVRTYLRDVAERVRKLD